MRPPWIRTHARHLCPPRHPRSRRRGRAVQSAYCPAHNECDTTSSRQPCSCVRERGVQRAAARARGAHARRTYKCAARALSDRTTSAAAPNRPPVDGNRSIPPAATMLGRATSLGAPSRRRHRAPGCRRRRVRRRHRRTVRPARTTTARSRQSRCVKSFHRLQPSLRLRRRRGPWQTARHRSRRQRGGLQRASRDRRPSSIRKLNMRGRSARPLCGTWSSRRAGYSKLIVYGNRRAQKFEIDRCSCVGNNSGLSPLRGPGLELLLVPSLLSKEG